jgi:predicted nucleic acid-binding Zn ribbon protein
MPTYVYKFIETGETIEVQQSFNDDTLTEAVHPDSGDTLPVKKVFLPVGVTFKGDGFYKTDSRSSGKSSASIPAGSSDSGSSSDSSGSSSGDSSGSSGSGSSGSSSDSSSGSSSSGSSSGSSGTSSSSD